jgi:hypothetical protein
MASNLTDYLNLLGTAEALRVKQAMHKVAALSIFALLSTAEISDVLARTATIDLAPKLQAAASSGYNWRCPEGVYAQSVQINGLKNGFNAFYGEGPNTEFRATAAMTWQYYKDGTDNGGTKDPVILHNIRFNANRLAGGCVRIGASKKGSLVGLQCDNFLAQAIRLGDDSAGATAMYYENDVRHINCDGNITYAASVGTMPTDGIYLTSNATDNTLFDVVNAYISNAGVQSWGGFNKLIDVHSYGDNSQDTGPKYNIIAGAATIIVAPECDNVTEAGIYVKFNSVVISGGSSYWAPDNVPSGATCFGSMSGTVFTATAVSPGALAVGQYLVGANVAAGTKITSLGTGTGGNGTYNINISQTVAATNMTAAGPVAVLIDASVGDCTIVGHELRGYYSINPAALWLGAARPAGLTAIFGGDIFTPQINDVPAMHSVRGGFLFARITGRDTRLIIDASTGMKARTELRLANALKYDYGFDGSNNFTISSWAGAVETVAMKHYYAAGQWEIYGKVLLPSGLRLTLATTNAPLNNGELTVSAPSNTSLTFQLKGSDGVVRSNTLTLA